MGDARRPEGFETSAELRRQGHAAAESDSDAVGEENVVVTGDLIVEGDVIVAREAAAEGEDPEEGFATEAES